MQPPPPLHDRIKAAIGIACQGAASMDSIRAVSERMQLMKQAAAVLGASMQKRHSLESSETITKSEVGEIITKQFTEGSHLMKSLVEKKAQHDALLETWSNRKSESITSSLMFPESGKLYFIELLLNLTDKGRSFDPRLTYADLKLVIDRAREAQIKAKHADVAAVTLQHLRDEIQDTSLTEGVRSDIMLSHINLSLYSAPRTAAAAPAASAASGAVTSASVRRNDRRRISDMPTWERNPWLPGLMTAFGDAHDSSTDSIRVVEGLLTHFVTRVVGAALEYADDPLEVSKLDVLHVLRKNKRFLSRVVTTYEHLEKFKEKKGDSSTFGPCNKGEQRENVLATRTFDDESAPPARGEASAPAISTRHDFSDAADGHSAAPRISIKVRKTS